MSREVDITHKIALLATGDEICQGDILNTNSQEIAHKLVVQGMSARLHLAAPDTISEIESAIRFLLQSHQALIITGGLGPTSDDLTRYALSNVTQCPLEFDEPTWTSLCDRLKKFGYDNPPESNRQQAMFPKGATIIPNPRGTAAACMMSFEDKFIFMLPGPPNECLPIVDSTVLPALKNAGFSRLKHYQSWLLFGVSEGKIAEELDAMTKPFACVTGYRLFYPYLEFKIHSDKQADFVALLPLLEAAIQPYLVGDGQKTASKLLQDKLIASKTILTICDHATGGALEAAINTPQTHRHLRFTPIATHLPRVEINGLTEYWQGISDKNFTDIALDYFAEEHHEEKLESIPFRGKHVTHYAVEWICKHLCELTEVSQTNHDLDKNQDDNH